jgi:predicted RNA-binding protein Jag
MNEGMEFEGKDLQEVLEAASASMGIAEPDLDYEIVEPGRRGLFGVGAKSIRIRVMPPVHGLPDESIRDKPQAAKGRARGAKPPKGPRSVKPPKGPRSAKPETPHKEPSAADAESVSGTFQKILDLTGLQLRTNGDVVDSLQRPEPAQGRRAGRADTRGVRAGGADRPGQAFARDERLRAPPGPHHRA